MLVVGQQEAENKTVSVRSRFEGDEGSKPLSEFVNAICEEIRTKAIREKKVIEEEKKDKESNLQEKVTEDLSCRERSAKTT